MSLKVSKADSYGSLGKAQSKGGVNLQGEMLYGGLSLAKDSPEKLKKNKIEDGLVELADKAGVDNVNANKKSDTPTKSSSQGTSKDGDSNIKFGPITDDDIDALKEEKSKELEKRSEEVLKEILCTTYGNRNLKVTMDQIVEKYENGSPKERGIVKEDEFGTKLIIRVLYDEQGRITSISCTETPREHNGDYYTFNYYTGEESHQQAREC